MYYVGGFKYILFCPKLYDQITMFDQNYEKMLQVGGFFHHLPSILVPREGSIRWSQLLHTAALDRCDLRSVHCVDMSGRSVERLGTGKYLLSLNLVRLFEMGVSKNSGTPKSSILIGFSIINHPFWGTPIFGNTQMNIMKLNLTPSGEHLSTKLRHWRCNILFLFRGGF